MAASSTLGGSSRQPASSSGLAPSLSQVASLPAGGSRQAIPGASVVQARTPSPELASSSYAERSVAAEMDRMLNFKGLLPRHLIDEWLSLLEQQPKIFISKYSDKLAAAWFLEAISVLDESLKGQVLASLCQLTAEWSPRITGKPYPEAREMVRSYMGVGEDVDPAHLDSYTNTFLIDTWLLAVCLKIAFVEYTTNAPVVIFLVDKISSLGWVVKVARHRDTGELRFRLEWSGAS